MATGARKIREKKKNPIRIFFPKLKHIVKKKNIYDPLLVVMLLKKTSFRFSLLK